MSLLGTARVYKRSRAVCAALCELYDLGLLNFSFEIQYTETKMISGVEYIDAADGNVMIGMTVVSYPAYPESTALLLVARKEKEEAGGKEETDPEQVIPGDAKTMERVSQDMELTLEQAMNRMDELDQTVKTQAAQIAAMKSLTQPRDEVITKADHDAALMEKNLQIAALEVQLTELNPLKERAETLETVTKELETTRQELDAIKEEQAQAALAARREELTNFANRHALNTEDEEISKAIAEANYEALVSTVMKTGVNGDLKTAATRRPMADIGVEDPYGGILDHRK